MMANSVLKAPSFYPNIIPQYVVKTTTNKPLCFTLTKHDNHNKNDDDFYFGMIEELVNQKLNLFVRELKKAKESKKTKGTNVNFCQQRRTNQRRSFEPLVSNSVTERLKLFIADDMKGSDMKLVIQKSLFKSDLNKDLNRLNIPIKQLKTDDFLTADEKEFLQSNKEHEIKVQVLGPRFRMHEETMGFKIWNMKRTQNYVLIGNWGNFVNDNKDDLKVNSKIQVWSFRKDQQLYLAIACVDDVA